MSPKNLIRRIRINLKQGQKLFLNNTEHSGHTLFIHSFFWKHSPTKKVIIEVTYGK